MCARTHELEPAFVDATPEARHELRSEGGQPREEATRDVQRQRNAHSFVELEERQVRLHDLLSELRVGDEERLVDVPEERERAAMRHDETLSAQLTWRSASTSGTSSA